MSSPAKPSSDMMTTREVADYLRIKERKVYDLVRLNRIPCTRVTGKLLFPKGLVDRWMAESTASVAEGAALPPVVAGSRDPLLDWAVRDSGSGLALMAGGSEDGLRRLAAGEAVAAGIHLLDPETGVYNVPAVTATAAHLGVVALEWAWREEGLLLPAGNPRGIHGLADLARHKAKVIRRQPGAGARVLFDHLAAMAGLAAKDLAYVEPIAMTGQEVGLAILEGKVEAGIGLRAVAKQLRLEFVPLASERFDLVLRRRDCFEPPFQKLLAFARGDAFRARAAELGGYDVTGLGKVRYNAP
jgi:excisionase family DNA binding protein